MNNAAVDFNNQNFEDKQRYMDRVFNISMNPRNRIFKNFVSAAFVSTTPTFEKKDRFTVIPQAGVKDAKAVTKASIATQFIGFGEGIVGKDGKRSTTQIYREQAGTLANTGKYSGTDVIFVSVPGLRGDATVVKREQDKTIKEAIKAIEAGATILTDNKAYIDSSSYNTGEKRLYQNLEAKGYNYSEIKIDGQPIGTWRKATAPITQPSTNLPGSDIKINIYAGTGENAELSNFASRPFTYNGISFPTVEHAFQYAKGEYYNVYAIDPADTKTTPDTLRAKIDAHLKNILNANTAAQVKALGRKNIGVDFENGLWDQESSGIMKNLLLESFKQNPDALAKLLATGNATLTHTQDKTKWGKEFPKLLMEVREELRGNQKPGPGEQLDLFDTQYQLPKGREVEEYVATEKTIRDLAARMSSRIGINVKFESDRTKKYKGKLANNTAIINLAYATLDTPIHEILGHPIIRAIKNGKQVLDRYKNTKVEKTSTGWGIVGKYNQVFDEFLTKEKAEEYLKNQQADTSENTKHLYQNLLKELETGRGKEVLDRIKRGYNIKSTKKVISEQYEDSIERAAEYARKNNITPNDGLFDFEGNTFFITPEYEVQRYGFTETEQIPDAYYSLEEQQEEAIVELLGMMTAEKLDAIKDGKLISLLKRLLKEIKAFMKQLLGQKEVQIDKLPDNMTIGDIADLLAYSNSKLILPGTEVVYTTPDNQQFKTYSEASNHISELAKNAEDVNLSNFIPNTKWRVTGVEWSYDEDGSVIGEGYINEEFNSEIEANEFLNRLSKHKYVGNLKLDKAGQLPQSFIEKNKQYEQSKEIIEEWKKVNNIKYNPEEIYSRGQEFSSVIGAYSNFDVNLMMQNLLSHIEDNEKAGGKFAVSAYTKPIDKQIGHLEGGGGKIKFKIYPQSQDILWAANTDVYSGSVWDASEKVSGNKKSELLGVSYTKYPSLGNVNSVQPNLAAIVDNLAHHHNELGIVLTGNNFRLEYDEYVPYTTKKIIDSINSILDQKYGKLIKPQINKITAIPNTFEYWQQDMNEDGNIDRFRISVFKKEDKWFVESFDTYGQSESIREVDYNRVKLEFKEALASNSTLTRNKGIQPTQTKDNLKESIDSVSEKVKIGKTLKSWQVQEILEGKAKKEDFIKNKEYTSQALINTKIAALKEVAKKYPRSLIRSEVRPIRKDAPLIEFKMDELPFQKLSSEENMEINDVQEKSKILNSDEFKNWFANEEVKNPDLDAMDALDYYIKCKR
jgi:predicted NAD-dependent protein-ADP-ribosyltransferase YbiA (DUF1768 family)